MKYEIIKFIDNGFEMEVKVSVEEKTVWLTANDMSRLFNVSKRNILLHMQNIYKDEELDSSTMKESFTLADDGKRRLIKFYNLDAIISCGFRVKSKRGILFRRWATNVIIDKLLENNSYIECKQNLINLENRVSKLEQSSRHQFLISEDNSIKGYISLKDFIKTAKQSIYIIDPYFDNSFDDILKEVDADITIIVNNKNKLESNDYYKVVKTQEFHDRFIFVDGVGYHFGSSFKDLGNAVSIAIKLEDRVLSRILKSILK